MSADPHLRGALSDELAPWFVVLVAADVQPALALAQEQRATAVISELHTEAALGAGLALLGAIQERLPDCARILVLSRAVSLAEALTEAHTIALAPWQPGELRSAIADCLAPHHGRGDG